MFDQSIVTIEDLIKVAEEQAKDAEKPEYKEEEKKEEKKKDEKPKEEDAEKTAAVLEAFADFLEKVADELPLDLAPVPGEQAKTQDTPLAEHDISDGGKTVDNEMETDERKPVKETQGHLGQPQPPMKPVTPDAPGVQSAPAKQEGPSKTAGILRQMQMAKLSEEGVPAGQLGYDSNAQAAHDRSEELLTEPNQVGMTQASESSGKVDKNQQAVDDTPKTLAEGPKKDMAQLLDEPMQSKKHDKVLADALPTMEPQAGPKVAQLLARMQKEAKKDPEAKALAKAEKRRKKELYKAEKAKGLKGLREAKENYRSKATWATKHPLASSVVPFTGSTTSEAKAGLKAMGKLKDAPWAVRHPGATKALGTLGGATLGAALGGGTGPVGSAVGGLAGGAVGYGAAGLGTSLAAKHQMRKATMGKHASDDHAISNFLRARQLETLEEE